MAGGNKMAESSGFSEKVNACSIFEARCYSRECYQYSASRRLSCRLIANSGGPLKRCGKSTPRALVPAVRLELTLCCQNWILSPARLPIPPRRLEGRGIIQG